MCVVCLEAQPPGYVCWHGHVVCARCWFQLSSPEQTQLELFEGGGGVDDCNEELRADLDLLEDITPPSVNRGGEAPSDKLPF